jgi:molybdate transport system ATP-binding protein
MKNQSLHVDIKKKLKLFDLDVDFTAHPGVLGILGPSGCGKSMTLKSIAGIVTPDSGTIALHGETQDRVLYDSAKKCNIRPQKRRIGYLFQNYALFPNMTVAQNILTGLNGKDPGGKIVAEMVERFHLQGLEHQYPRQLSGGQQQRVALARILAYEPEALLLDEPFSAMDTFLREQLRLELAKVLHEYDGISIMVTHDRDEAYQLCDQLMLMSEGRILTAGPTREIFADPKTVAAARLTGCKNISRIEKLADHRVRALDWKNLELVTEKEITDEITHIGIRAHDFEPVSGEAAETAFSKDSGSGKQETVQTEATVNLIPTGDADIAEMPFEWYITLDNDLWWKKEKTIHTHTTAGLVPQALRIDPSAILLLRS